MHWIEISRSQIGRSEPVAVTIKLWSEKPVWGFSGHVASLAQGL